VGPTGPAGGGSGSSWYTFAAGSDVSMNNFSFLDLSSVTFDDHISFLSNNTQFMTLDASGTMNMNGSIIVNPSQTNILFSTPGTQTYTSPTNATSLYFEIVGAGGHGGDASGGYYKGLIDITALTGNTLELNVGVLGEASYIKDISSGLMFIIAGAGGSAGTSGSGGNGGSGIGTLYTTSNNSYYYVANGANGSGTTPGSGGTYLAGNGGVGGASGGIPDLSGNGLPINAVAGGSAATGGLGDGGGGYAGGGGGSTTSGGGGGSSYRYSDFVYLTGFSGPGNLTGYGGPDQTGAILLSYVPTAIKTNDGDILINGQLAVNDTFYVNGSVVNIYNDPNSLRATKDSQFNIYTDKGQLRLYAQNNTSVPGKIEGTIGFAQPAELGGGWVAPTITFDLSQSNITFYPHGSFSQPMIYDNSGNLNVHGAMISTGGVVVGDQLSINPYTGLYQNIVQAYTGGTPSGLNLNTSTPYAAVYTGSNLVVGSPGSPNNSGNADVNCGALFVNTSGAVITQPGASIHINDSPNTVGGILCTLGVTPSPMNLNPTIAGTGDGAAVRTGGPLVVGYGTNATVGGANVNCGSLTMNNGFLVNTQSANVYSNYYLNITSGTPYNGSITSWTLTGTTDALGTMSSGNWTCSVPGIYIVTLTVSGNCSASRTVYLTILSSGVSTILKPSITISPNSFSSYYNGTATCTVYINTANSINATTSDTIDLYGETTANQFYNTLSFTRIC